MGKGGGVRQDTKDSGNIFANKRKLNLRPRMASFVRPSSTNPGFKFPLLLKNYEKE